MLEIAILRVSRGKSREEITRNIRIIAHEKAQ